MKESVAMHAIKPPLLGLGTSAWSAPILIFANHVCKKTYMITFLYALPTQTWLKTSLSSPTGKFGRTKVSTATIANSKTSWGGGIFVYSVGSTFAKHVSVWENMKLTIPCSR